MFFFLQVKTERLKERDELKKQAERIQSGDIYSITIEGNALKPAHTIRYVIVESKDGYVSYRYPEYLAGEPHVELATDFLKYKSKELP